MSTSSPAKTCTRCHGTGNVPFQLDGGRCWGCFGAGTMVAQKATKPFYAFKSARIERRNSLGGPIDVSIWRRGNQYRVTISEDLATTFSQTFASEVEARATANAQYKAAKANLQGA